MASIRSLAKETAVYGLSSIYGRLLNWGLVPLYVYLFPAEEYGIVSNLYSWTAVMLVILNYGMETGYFRFANKEGADPQKVYTTSLISVGFTSILFIALLTIFIHPISGNVLLLPKHPEYVWLLGTTVAIDAFTNIPFAQLRYKKKAWTFAGIKLINILLTIGLNLFFLLGCPWLQKHAPGVVDWFYAPLGGFSYGIGWIFIANFIATCVVLLLLLPQMVGMRYRYDWSLLKKMLKYSWPLLVLGVAGIMSQNMGQIMIPYIFSDNPEAARQMVGIYGANIKIAIIMVMFTQAFRYAYEPFIFAQAKSEGEDHKQGYADAMKYFVIFGMLIFLGVMFLLPVVKHFIAPAYWGGLAVVPIMMMAEIFFGVYFNLSLWYKLTDRTMWGMSMSLIGFVLMFGFNMLLVPLIGIPKGYLGSAWAAFLSYFAIMLISYFVGKKYMPIPYQIKRITVFVVIALVMYVGGMAIPTAGHMAWVAYPVRMLLLAIYVVLVCASESVPVLSKFVKKNRIISFLIKKFENLDKK